MTSQSERAYQIADRFRARGKKVVLGGVHPTILPEEAREHADAVVIGEAERIWPELLLDAENQKLQAYYREDTFPPLDGAGDPKVARDQPADIPPEGRRAVAVNARFHDSGVPVRV